MSDLQAIDPYLQQSQPKQLEPFKELSEIPSVSADGAPSEAVSRAAKSVLDTLAAASLSTKLVERDGDIYARGAHLWKHLAEVN